MREIYEHLFKSVELVNSLNRPSQTTVPALAAPTRSAAARERNGFIFMHKNWMYSRQSKKRIEEQ